MTKTDDGVSRKDFLKLMGTGLGALAFGRPSFAQPLTPTLSRPDMTRPNILFICVDQHRSWQDLPDLGLSATNLLRKQGTEFTNFHSNMAPCAPSRSVIYSGQQVQKTGMHGNPPTEVERVDLNVPHLEMSRKILTVGHMLREQGYYTAYKGKWHLGMINQGIEVIGRAYPNASNMLEDYGFSDYSFDGEHIGLTWGGFHEDGFIAADAVRQMERYNNGDTAGKPWFMAVNLINPHDVMFYDATGHQNDTRATRDHVGLMREAPPVGHYLEDLGEPLPASYYQDDLSTKPMVQRNAEQGSGRFYGTIERDDEAAWRRHLNYYYNCIRDVDRHIHTLLQAVERLGLAENTVIVFTSDHGEYSGAHGLRGKGASMYKENLRVPLVIRHPQIPEGRKVDSLACSLDLAPTLLGLAGLDESARRDRYPDLRGSDLTPHLAGAATTARDQSGILFQSVGAGPGLTPDGPRPGQLPRILLRGIFDGRYKFARYFALNQHHRATDWETLVGYNDLELYDTHNDPDELENLAFAPDSQRTLILELNAKLNRLMDDEITADEGAIYPGPREAYLLKT